MRKCAALLLGLAFVLMGAFPAAAYKGQVTIALPNDPPTMEPHAVANFIANIVLRWSYDSLLSSETGTGKLIPWLAERWEKLSPTAYKFWLRKGVKFSDGTPLTAESVKLAVERTLASAQQGPYFKSHGRLEILDGHTFIWHLKYPDNGLLIRLPRWVQPISLNVMAMDKAEVSRKSFGTGPYVLKEWTKGQKMVFEASPDWWANGRFPNRPKTVILRQIPEASTRVNALLTGEVDIVTAVAPQFIPQIEGNPATRVVSVPGVRIMYLGFITRHGGPLADPKVRLAVNYAIDAEKIRKTLLGGRADDFGQLLHPWSYSGHNPAKTWHGHDLAKAKALMKESSHPAGFKADLISTVGRYPGDKPTCEALSGMLKGIAIDASCKALNFPLYRKTLTAAQEGKQKGALMYYMGFGGGAGDPSTALKALVSCKGAWSGNCAPELDVAIDKAAGAADSEEQQAAFEKVTDLMKERATHKVIAKIHDVYGFRANIEFRPRHDENLYVWEIGVK